MLADSGFSCRCPLGCKPRASGMLDAGLRHRPFPDDTASLLPGPLTATRTGLTPASDDELANQPSTIYMINLQLSGRTIFFFFKKKKKKNRRRTRATATRSRSSTTACGCTHRFPLSFREVEELMLVRGVVVSYETIRRWCAKFGQAYANQLRRRRPRPGDKWHLDEVFVEDQRQRCVTCGARSTSTATCSTFSSSHAETRRRPSDSSVNCSRACGTCRGCWSPTSWAATRSPTASSCRRWSTGGRGI